MWRLVCLGPFSHDPGDGTVLLYYVMVMVWAWVATRRLRRGL